MVRLKDDIQKQLDALLDEVRALSRSVVNLRQDDLRVVFGEQIRPILMERVEKACAPGTDRNSLTGLVDAFVTSFQQEGAAAASRVLDEFEADLHPLPGGSPGYGAKLVSQMREYLSTSEYISQQAGPPPRAPTLAGGYEKPLSPEAVERALAPLSSSRRVEVMLRLLEDSESLAGLSRALGMKKGHLQFHLNVLVEAGHISYDKKTHLYSLTDKGGRALDGLSGLVGALGG